MITDEEIEQFYNEVQKSQLGKKEKGELLSKIEGLIGSVAVLRQTRIALGSTDESLDEEEALKAGIERQEIINTQWLKNNKERGVYIRDEKDIFKDIFKLQVQFLLAEIESKGKGKLGYYEELVAKRLGGLIGELSGVGEIADVVDFLLEQNKKDLSINTRACLFDIIDRIPSAHAKVEEISPLVKATYELTSMKEEIEGWDRLCKLAEKKGAVIANFGDGRKLIEPRYVNKQVKELDKMLNEFSKGKVEIGDVQEEAGYLNLQVEVLRLAVQAFKDNNPGVETPPASPRNSLGDSSRSSSDGDSLRSSGEVASRADSPKSDRKVKTQIAKPTFVVTNAVVEAMVLELGKSASKVIKQFFNK